MKPQIATLEWEGFDTLKPTLSASLEALEMAISIGASQSNFEAATSLCMETRNAWAVFYDEALRHPGNLGPHTIRLRHLLMDALSEVSTVKNFRDDDPSDRDIVKRYAASIQQRLRLLDAFASGGLSAVDKQLQTILASIVGDQTAPEQQVSVRQAKFAYLSNRHLKWLIKDPSRLTQLSPREFEEFVAERLVAMGFEAKFVTNTNSPDGGIDIIAWPKLPVPFPFLLATQVKHHRAKRPTGVGQVRDFLGTMKLHEGVFAMGLMVTNTTFTANAKWFAANSHSIIRLKDFHDLCKWMSGNFIPLDQWCDFPKRIEISKGIFVDIPERELWTPTGDAKAIQAVRNVI
jgi:hypothetical protein